MSNEHALHHTVGSTVETLLSEGHAHPEVAEALEGAARALRAHGTQPTAVCGICGRPACEALGHGGPMRMVERQLPDPECLKREPVCGQCGEELLHGACPFGHAHGVRATFKVGDRVVFRGIEHEIFANGDRPGTFDICQPGWPKGTDRWLNVPPDQFAVPDGVQGGGK
jgi:hypothetical protein